MRCSSFVLRAALAYISIPNQVHLATAQFGIERPQAASWTPASTCGSGGTYTDPYGAVWSVNCGQDNTGAIYASGGTSGQGIYACFKGCSHRPECNGFSFTGSVTLATAGSGTCYYRTAIGSYYTNSTNYAAANLMSYAPTLPVCNVLHQSRAQRANECPNSATATTAQHSSTAPTRPGKSIAAWTSPLPEVPQHNRACRTCSRACQLAMRIP